MPRQPAPPATIAANAGTPTPVTAEITARRSWAALAQAKFRKNYPNAVVSSTGVADDTLYLNDSAFDERFVKAFRQKQNLAEIKKLGFKTVRISGKGNWLFDL